MSKQISMPQCTEQEKEYANLGVGKDLNEIITLFFSSVLLSSNALFISSQARSVLAFLKY